jgi:stalled ribosome rescue protein Dom34
MTMIHAVVWIDHQNAQILQFDPEHVQASKVKLHSHQTRQHGSAVRSDHEYFGAVCDSLADIREVLVTGSHQVQGDLRHYVEKHRPHLARQIVGYETVDHPSENQLIALARRYFLKYDRMSGVPTPT